MQLRLRRRSSICLYIVALLLVTIAIVSYNNRPPTISVPAQKVPTPNGWDDFVLAGKMTRKIGHEGPYSSFKKPEQWSLAELKSFVKDNEPALAVLRRGLSKPYLHPPIRSYRVVRETFQDYGMIREAGRSLIGESRYYSVLGMPEKQADCILDCMELGVIFPRGGSYLTALMGRSIESKGAEQIESVIPKLSPNALAAVGDRLERIRQKRVHFSEIALEDGWVDIALYTEKLQNPYYRRVRQNPINWFILRKWDSLTPEDVLFNIQFTFANKRSAPREYETYFKALSTEQRGYYTGKSAVPVPNNIILKMSSDSDIKRRRFIFARNEATFSILQTEVALKRYHEAHGRYPRTLAELVPQYLKTVPIDPLGRGKSLRYRLQNGGKSYLLYSLGFNMTDHNGMPEPLHFRESGDLVAGKLNY